MTGAEIFVVYVYPFILVAAGLLLAWHNHVVMRRAHARDAYARLAHASADLPAAKGEPRQDRTL